MIKALEQKLNSDDEENNNEDMNIDVEGIINLYFSLHKLVDDSANQNGGLDENEEEKI